MDAVQPQISLIYIICKQREIPGLVGEIEKNSNHISGFYSQISGEWHIWGVSRQLFCTWKNCLISVSDVFFLQLSNDVGSFSEIFHFDLQKLFRILFLAENISGTICIYSYVKNGQLSI